MPSLVDSSGLTSWVVPGGKIVVTRPTVSGATALKVALKDEAGNDITPASPLFTAFRQSASSGALYEGRHVTTSPSVTIADGSTLGATANVPFRVSIALVDDNGTFRIAVRNSSTTEIAASAEFGTLSATADVGGAGTSDFAGQWYADVDITSKRYRLLGYCDFNVGLPTPGAWTLDPDAVQMFGPGIPRPGAEVQAVIVEENSNVAGGTIAYNNSTPSGGAQVLTGAMTPTSPVNLCETRIQLIAASSAPAIVSGYLTVDGAVLAATPQYQPGGDKPATILIEHVFPFASAVQVLFAVYFGVESGSCAINGTSSAPRFNGRSRSFLKIKEIMVG